MRDSVRKYLVVGALGAAACLCLAGALSVPAEPARAQLKVFDPTNYSQNLLSAARALSQIDNQIKSLQNEAQMLLANARNLQTIDFPELQQVESNLQAIDRLMGQAQGIDFRIDGLEAQLDRLFPRAFNQALGTDGRVRDAKARLDAASAAYRQTMGVQSHVVSGLRADAAMLATIVGRSQNAQGALQAQQATNQLLALAAKQQFQIQDMMAAQYRAEATEAARRAQAEADGRAATRKFLGSGTAYTRQ